MSIQSHNLSIIAVRILPNCREYIRKCLKEEIFYYLNTNYEISNDGDTVRPREGYVENICDDFFNLDGENKSPNISISAIVGKNGDGKSSLIEVIIRVVNNFACITDLNPYDHLLWIEGLAAEIYYKMDNHLYRVVAERKEKTALYQYEWAEEEKAYVHPKIIEKDDTFKSFFYTLVANYSLYAYNTEEFDEVCIPPKDLSENVWENHWLHRVFHKNDAYQTPINLHPFRIKGNLDVNKERRLSRQRLLTVVAKTFRKTKDDEVEKYTSDFNINGKKPVKLELYDTGYSKFHSQTIKKYLKDNKEQGLFENIQRALNVIGMGVISPAQMLQTNWENRAIEALNALYDKCIKGHEEFFQLAYEFLDKEHLSKESESIGNLYEELRRSRDKLAYALIEEQFQPKEKKWGVLSELSLLQVQRLILVREVCNYWKKGFSTQNGLVKIEVDAKTLFKPFNSLIAEEKAKHYLIYKTISIFETYDVYKQIGINKSILHFLLKIVEKNGEIYPIERLFNRLKEDWEIDSHYTLKIRQSYRYLTDPEGLQKLYALDDNGQLPIRFLDMRPEMKKALSDMEMLPPPIFEWELFFHVDNSKTGISLTSFSSGEKQKTFFIAAILYHLQNLCKVGHKLMKYAAVNLIFEEIELYFHPEWQRTLIFDLMKAIRTAYIPKITSINMIFVTHSPYILSDIPKSNVLFLKEGRPNYDMQENTFGANINSLLKNGFFLPSLPMGEFAYRKINTLFEKLHTGNFDNVDLDQIYAQIMTVGEPAIRMQLMTLFAPYNILRRTSEDTIEKLRNFLSKSQT